MYRHRRKIIACIGQILISGCVSRTSIQPLKVVKPESLTEYINAVYKISHEGAVQDSEAYDRLLKENAEIADLAKRIAQNPTDLKSKRQLALEFLDHGLNWRAYDLLAELQPALPLDSDVALALARIWDLWGDRDLARQYAAQAIQLDGKSAAAYDTLARICLHSNDPAQAIPAFLKASELEPANPAHLADAGYAFMLRSDWKHAKTYLEQALAVDSSLPQASNNLAIVLGQLGDYDGALRQFAETSRPAAALNNLGVVYLSQNKPKEATQSFQQALKADPDYERAKANLPEPPKTAKAPTIVHLTPWPAATKALPAPAVPPASALPAAVAQKDTLNALPTVKPIESIATADPGKPVEVTQGFSGFSPLQRGSAAAGGEGVAHTTPLPAEPMAAHVQRGTVSLLIFSAPATATDAVPEAPKSSQLVAAATEPAGIPAILKKTTVPADLKIAAVASNPDPVKQELKQKSDSGYRGIATSKLALVIISLMGAAAGEALGRTRGMLIGAAIGPMIEIALQIQGLLR